MKITFRKNILPTKGVVFFPFSGVSKLSENVEELDKKLNGFISHSLKALKNEKEFKIFPAPKDSHLNLLIGYPLNESPTIETLQKTGGKIGQLINQKSYTNVSVILDSVSLKDFEEHPACHVAFGMALGAYTFDKYKKDKPENDTEVGILTPKSQTAKDDFTTFESVLNGIYTARDLVSEPANALYPEEFVERLKTLDIPNLSLTILDEEEMKRQKMNLILGVGQGAKHRPYLAILSYRGSNEEKPPLAFVGKGVCFDAGGISLKPSRGMGDMKYDMAGAAGVLGAVLALSLNQDPVNVVGIMPLVENMPDGNAIRPGDVLTSLSGKTVEVGNTDAEGRLILADAIWYAEEMFKPKVIIDMATLTGAVKYALGGSYAGLFSNSSSLTKELMEISKTTTNDKLWPMPMNEEYHKLMKSPIADISNIASKPEAGGSTAAHFLEEFIQKTTHWAHLDIAGVAWADNTDPVQPKGATGFGVQLLRNFALKTWEE